MSWGNFEKRTIYLTATFRLSLDIQKLPGSFCQEQKGYFKTEDYFIFKSEVALSNWETLG